MTEALHARITAAREAGDQSALSEALGELASHQAAQPDELDDAAETYREAVQAAVMDGDPAAETAHLRGLGQLLAAQERYELARIALEKAQTRAAALGDLAGLALTLRVIAAVKRKQGDMEGAQAIEADASRYEACA